jgi:1-acyl-sn-glycerol-3-phosphate acyltransferase
MERFMRATEDLKIETPRVRRGNIVLHLIARMFFFLSRWQITGCLPNERKLVAIGAPHTSNYDGLLMLMLSWLLYLRLDWMVKAELGNHWLLGPIVRVMGGVSIDRSASFNAVEQAVQQFEERDDLWLVIAPEGTRRKTDHWRTGFYWIAHNAGVPILMARVDYKSKVVHLVDPVLYPSGQLEADMEKIWNEYRVAAARHPERVGEMRLRPTARRME